MHDARIGGWASRRKPMSLVRAIARSKLRDLTVVSYAGPTSGCCARSAKSKGDLRVCVARQHRARATLSRRTPSGWPGGRRVRRRHVAVGLYARRVACRFCHARRSRLRRDGPHFTHSHCPLAYEDGQELVAMLRSRSMPRSSTCIALTSRATVSVLAPICTSTICSARRQAPLHVV